MELSGVLTSTEHVPPSSQAGGAARSAPGVAAHYPHTKMQHWRIIFCLGQ